MMDAHTDAGFIVGLPFAAEGLYDFAAHGDSTRRVANLGAIMLQVRRCPLLPTVRVLGVGLLECHDR